MEILAGSFSEVELSVVRTTKLTKVYFKTSNALSRFYLFSACRLSVNKCKILDLNFIQDYQ